MTRLPLILATLAAFGAPAVAQTPAAPAPATTAPADAPAMLPLSQILAKVEAEADFVRFDDIEWNDRDSTWEVEYRGTGGRTVSMEVAGATGEPVAN